MSEKTEHATPYKLKKAKEQGQVSKSNELNICILLSVMLVITHTLWPSILDQLKDLSKHLLSLIDRIHLDVDTIINLHQFLTTQIIWMWAPFALAGIITIILSHVVQTGFVWSLKPIIPDFKRLDLAKGFKRWFSMQSLFIAGKSSFKLALILLLLVLSLKHELKTLFKCMTMTPDNSIKLFLNLMIKVMLQLTTLLFALAVIDKLYTRWKFAKDQKMSKQELKDEYKQREGDPKIKSKIKQLQQKLRQKTASLNQVKTADVVVTNPTHLAIALKYERGQMPAPKVVCKAHGDLAKQVKILAARHQIPIIEHPLFARALFSSIEVNQWINQEHFPVAAMIFSDLYRQRTVSDEKK